MAASEQFSLCWDNFLKNMSSGMNSLLESEDLVDVTLAVQGKHLKAHKMVLSVCSPYFKELFKSNPCQHPIVFMKDVSYEALKDLLTFMYQGEVQVSQENLTTFIKTAEALQIKGLTGDGNGTSETEVQEVTDKPRVEEYKHISRPKKQSTTISSAPQAKRSRLSVSSNESQPSSAIPSKSEPLTSPTESSQFKVEPYEQAQSLQDDLGEENFGDDTMDENTVDDGEDYSMMESGHGDEPQASTSTDGTGEGQDGKGLFRTGGIIIDGFTYHQNTTKKDGNRYFICSEYKKLSCRARVSLSANINPIRIALSSKHNHPPHATAVVKDLFIREIKAAIATQPERPLKETYNLVATFVPQGPHVCPFSKLHTSMRRWRSIVSKNKRK